MFRESFCTTHGVCKCYLVLRLQMLFSFTLKFLGPRFMFGVMIDTGPVHDLKVKVT